MKKLALLLSVLFITTIVPINVEACRVGPDGFVEIESNTDSGSRVYKNYQTGDMYADINISSAQTGDKIILYRNLETGETVSIDIDEIASEVNTRASGDTGWSSGWLTSGTTTITPNYQSGLLYIGFTMSVSAFPVTINNVYNPVVEIPIHQASEVNTHIVSKTATNSIPATASMTFVSALITDLVGSATSGYVTCHINSDGNVRVEWRY